ncbi:hypothetical protein HYH03_005965 [Edaphochlamys debaryana]|uniref:ShKT domain-containing protein n=1 Tax=Edaphochlamys debaryana TaxID=47281 RepID=A0A836C1Z7_9CHLO|nr:hypothetical protein HYH03_005965 [Edaphochlamys debaryana]|eukprot:KAG2496044.1 hypothetical protein HYH03_005965 [Edaphochlamys debaryana]
MLEHAAKAAQCTTCHVLASVTWTRLTSDILSGETVTPHLVRAHLDDACEKDALDTVLRKYTILKMESDAGGGTQLLFFVVRERRGNAAAPKGSAQALGSSATDAEEAAVALSCRTLIRESSKDLVAVLMEQLSNYRREALRLLVKHARDGGNEQDPPLPPASGASTGGAGGAGASGKLPRLDGSGGRGAAASTADDDDEYMDPDDLDDDGEVITKPSSSSAAKGSAAAAEGGAAKDEAAAAKGGAGADEKAGAKGAGSGSGSGAAAAAAGEKKDDPTAAAAAAAAGKGKAAEKDKGKGKAGGKEGAAGARVVRGLVIKVMPGEPECADLHVKCGEWAALGECEVNPNYMIGTNNHIGHCKKACGMCQPSDLLKVAPALASELESLSSALLLAVKNLGCGASGACLTGVSGMAVGAGLVKGGDGGAGAGGAGGLQGGGAGVVGGTIPITPGKPLPPGMKEFPGGFILGKPWWAVPDVRMVPPHLRKPVPGEDGKVPPAAQADAGSGSGSGSQSGSGSGSGSVPSGTGSGAGVPGSDASTDPSASGSGSGSGSAPPQTAPSHAAVDAVLAPALAHRLLSIPSDFFVYEYLYKNHTRHFHPDSNGRVTEDWLLGKFSRESLSLLSSVTGEAAGLEDLDLLPGSVQAARLQAHTWPYVKQVYAGGDECVLGGGRRVVRRVEARIACSPDAGTYMLIREPDFCTYTFVVYTPALCALDYYKPRPRPGVQQPPAQGQAQAQGQGQGQQAGAGSGKARTRRG